MTSSTLVPALVLMAAMASGPWMSTDATCPVIDVYESAPVRGTYIENGNLHWPGEPKNRSYPPSLYHRRETGSGIVYEVCACARKPCMIQCCKPDKPYAFSEAMCSEMSYKIESEVWVPQIVTANGSVQKYPINEIHILFTTLNCVSNNTNESFTFSENGSFCSGSGLSILAQPSQFCVYKRRFHTIGTSNSDTYIPMILRILSYQLLIATFLVYALNKKLQNIYGKSLMCNVLSLIVKETFTFIKFFTEDLKNVCVIRWYIKYFFNLASSFWFNIMCFEIWRTFSKRWPIKWNYTESKTFTIYSIYAWGIPSLFSMFVYIMDIYGSFYEVLKPGILDNCLIHSQISFLIYIAVPKSVIFLSNVLMFIHVTVSLYNQMKVSKILNQSNSNRSINQTNKQRFMIHLNLMLAMGINWSHEIILLNFHEKLHEENILLYNILYYLYTSNGIIYFLIFVCKKMSFD